MIFPKLSLVRVSDRKAVPLKRSEPQVFPGFRCTKSDAVSAMYRGEICGRRVDIFHIFAIEPGNFTMYLDGDENNVYFCSEPEAVARQKIQEFARGGGR